MTCAAAIAPLMSENAPAETKFIRTSENDYTY